MNARTIQVANGVVRIEQRTRVRGRAIGTDVSGPAVIVADVHVRRGTVCYVHGDRHVAAPSRFALCLPPFSVVQAVLEHCDVTSVGVALRPTALSALPTSPILLLPDDPEGLDVGRSPAAPPLPARVKRIIDAEYGGALAIGGIAARLRASPALVSRVFRRAYGMPPVEYRHRVRIIDALVRLAGGAVPIDVFQDVGFDDLSRFYKLFRKLACAPPGAYQSRRARIAKT